MKKIISVLLIMAVFMLLLKVPQASAEPSISAKAAVVINGITREVIYAKNADMQLSMASTTKIMTSLLLAEAGELDKTETVCKLAADVEGSSIGINEGDRISREALLAGMLLESGNDAATQTAISLAGSLEAFSEIMNQRAKLIGMKNTNFVTPSGLDAPGHHTTAYDMALLTAEALGNKTFREFSAAYKMTVSFGNPEKEHVFTNHNKLLNSYEGCIGVKTGYTSKSGRCLVSAARRNGALIIAVTLNDPNDWQDHKTLLDYGFEKVSLLDITYSGEDMSVAVAGGEADRVQVVVPTRLAGLDDNSKKDIHIKVSLPKFVYAPTKAGQKVGTVQYYYKDMLLAQDSIYIAADLDIFTVYESKEIKFRRSFRLLLSFYK